MKTEEWGGSSKPQGSIFVSVWCVITSGRTADKWRAGITTECSWELRMHHVIIYSDSAFQDYHFAFCWTQMCFKQEHRKLHSSATCWSVWESRTNIQEPAVLWIFDSSTRFSIFLLWYKYGELWCRYMRFSSCRDVCFQMPKKKIKTSVCETVDSNNNNNNNNGGQRTLCEGCKVKHWTQISQAKLTFLFC